MVNIIKEELSLEESLNYQFRKYTTTKSVFPTDMSLMKCLYSSKKI